MFESVSSTSHDPQTRERLLQAAGEVFARRGFERATVREICRKAHANVAAVNYHFGGKRRLYTEAIQYGVRRALETFPPDLGLGPRPTPEQRLQAFIRAFLHRFLDTGQPEWHARLVARELVEPTPALDALVERIIRPLSERLRGIVRDLLGKQAGDETVRRCTLSIVGQCLLYHHSRPVLERLYGRQRYTEARIEELARHITQFSLGAIRCLRNESERRA